MGRDIRRCLNTARVRLTYGITSPRLNRPPAVTGKKDTGKARLQPSAWQHFHDSKVRAPRAGCLTSGRVSDTRTIIPHARGRGAREGRGPSRKPASCSHGAPRPPPARLSRIAERCAAAARGPAEPARYRFADGLSVEVQLFKAAPSGTMPCVANRHSAIRSFRATATIAIRRMRPRRVPTNAANQRLIADPGW